MAFPVDVLALSGRTFRVNARDDWSVWQLKCAVEKATGTHPSLQKLANADGFELLDGPLCDFCSIGEEPVQIYLVKMPRSKEDAEWYERWSADAPDWLQTMALGVMDDEGIKRFRSLAEDYKDTVSADGYTARFLNTPIRFSNFKKSEGPHPTKVLETLPDPKAKAALKVDQKTTLRTGADVLTAVKRSGLGLEAVYREKGQMATLKWRKSQSTEVTRDATWDAVAAAIAEDPCAMFDPLMKAAWMDEEDLVELVLPVIAKHPEVYEALPDCLMEERRVLYAALEADAKLKAKFLRTAGRAQIREWREWQWPTASNKSRCRWSSRCKDGELCFS